MNRFVAFTLVAILALCGYALASPDSGYRVADCSGTACYGVVDCSAPAVASCSGTVQESPVCAACGQHHHHARVFASRAHRIEHGGWYAGKVFVERKPVRRVANAAVVLPLKILAAPVKAVRCVNGQCHRH